jgi:hypothetical protein
MYLHARIAARLARQKRRQKHPNREAVGASWGNATQERSAKAAVFIDLTGAGSMNPENEALKPLALAALLLSSAVLFGMSPARAHDPSPNTTASRPAKTPTGQTSEPSAAPPASRTQTTGESNQDATTQKMNEDEKKKVNTEGK